MHLLLAMATAWIFSYYAGSFSSRYRNRMFTNIVIGVFALAGSVVGLALGMGIQSCCGNILVGYL